MKIYHGLPASPGVVIAPAKRYIRTSLLDRVPEVCVVRDMSIEVETINHALANAKKHLDNMRNTYVEKDLVDALELIVENIVQEALDLVNAEKICSSLAIKKVYEKYAELLRSTGSQLFAVREADLRVAVEMLLSGIFTEEANLLPLDISGKIVISEELGITEFFELLRRGIKGLITSSGGVTSHVAIVARCNSIPYVITPSLDASSLKDETYVILDALNGLVIIEPDETTMKSYESKAENYWRTLEQIAKHAYEKAVTLDGYYVDVLCNVGNLEEARLASTLGCDGIGLFRIEFLYMKTKPPTTPELQEIFEKAASFFENKPVVIRAPDIGADKPVPYLSLREENPFMGLRGIRLLLEYREELFKPFVEAFLRAYKNHPNLKLLLPMVSRVSEVLETIELIKEVAGKLNIDISGLNLGIMVEVPSTALLLDKFAETGKVRFISYGTNDLTQYVLAVDRTNPKVGAIYDDLDPSVLRLLNLSMSTAIRNNLEVEVCGELASKQLAIPILLSLGVNALSVNYSVVGVVKYTIRGIHVGETKEHLIQYVLNSMSSQEVKETLKKYLLSKGLAVLG
ncbi:MAG: phosphoenolpyruvate--protein phosphotransferase [Desulfurococcaceae archaeon]